MSEKEKKQMRFQHFLMLKGLVPIHIMPVMALKRGLKNRKDG
jgi:hypothetical protein